MPQKADIPQMFEVVTYCIAHTDPVIPFSEKTIQLEIGPPGTLDRARYPSVVNCFELVHEGEKHRRELGSVLGSFAARHHILQSDRSLDFAINIATYRTFMLADKRSAHHSAKPKLNFITPEEARVMGDIAVPTEAPEMWRLPMPLGVSSIADQYAQWHELEDLRLYLDAAVAVGVLSVGEEEKCLNRRVLLPGALSVGMMPARVFCDLNEQLEATTRGFLEHFEPEGRDDYQIRAANFCHERLGSYLLERYIHKMFGGLDARLFGYWTRVDENLRYSRGRIAATPA